MRALAPACSFELGAGFEPLCLSSWVLCVLPRHAIPFLKRYRVAAGSAQYNTTTFDPHGFRHFHDPYRLQKAPFVVDNRTVGDVDKTFPNQLSSDGTGMLGRRVAIQDEVRVPKVPAGEYVVGFRW